MGNIHVKLNEFGPMVQKEMSFKEKGNGRTNDRLRPITIPHLHPSAQVS